MLHKTISIFTFGIALVAATIAALTAYAYEDGDCGWKYSDSGRTYCETDGQCPWGESCQHWTNDFGAQFCECEDDN